MHLKSIIYAYAHSADARRFGYALSGCWTVNLRKDNQPPQALSGFETYGEALKVADAMGEDFDPVHHAPDPDEIRTAPPHSAAVLIRRQRRAPASLGGIHYHLEKGERVRIQRVSDTHATCYLGEPAERRVSEDYFPVPIDALKLLYRGEGTVRHGDFSTPESNFTFTMEEVQP